MAKKTSRNAVGYKRPPKGTQFKPGRSGNPKGRPKGSKDLRNALQKELKTHVDVTENGVRKRMTKQEAFVKQLVNKAVSGDPRSTPLLLKATALTEESAAIATAAEDYFVPVDDRVLASLIARIRQAADPVEVPTAPAASSGKEE